MCVLTEFNVLVKTHVCFHQDPSQAPLHSARVPKVSPILTINYMGLQMCSFMCLFTFYGVARLLSSQGF